MGVTMKTYLYRVELKEEDDHRWSAWIEALPGCTSWGSSKEEALDNIQDALKAYTATLQEMGKPIPTDENTRIVEAPAVSIAV